MRLALGAGRWRLVRQLLVENVILATSAESAGSARALGDGRPRDVHVVGQDANRAASRARCEDPRVHRRGLHPHRHHVRTRAGRCGRPESTSSRASRARHAARLAEATGSARERFLSSRRWRCACCSSSAAGLFVRSLQGLDGQDDGFDRETCSSSGSSHEAATSAACRRVRSARPDLSRSARSASARSPASAPPASRTTVRPAALATQARSGCPTARSSRRSADDGLPELFCDDGHPVPAGRDFTERDLDESAPLVGVVNEAFVRQDHERREPGRQADRRRAGRRSRAKSSAS